MRAAREKQKYYEAKVADRRTMQDQQRGACNSEAKRKKKVQKEKGKEREPSKAVGGQGGYEEETKEIKEVEEK